MIIEVKVPTVGESITEAVIGSWSKKNGEFVKRNDILLLLETDKASVEVVAENDGVLQTLVEAGQTVLIGSIVAKIDTAKTDTAKTAGASPTPATTSAEPPRSPSSSTPQPLASMSAAPLSPAVQRIVGENKIDATQIAGTGKDGRVTKGDALQYVSTGGTVSIPNAASAQQTKSVDIPKAPSASVMVFPTSSKQGDKKVVPMTNIRKKIAERLLEAQHTTAHLTTFNEIDMTRLNELRAKYKDKFKDKYGLSLGFMGLFTKAAVEALKAFPAVNAYIVNGDSVEYHNYYNIGIAVSTERGLMVPVVKDCDVLSVPQIEMRIREYALKARDGKITVDDLNGGTFSITNGGVFGSLLSTPILNPPQSAILGMHKIEDRAVVINGKVEVRPMMYIALSYDHRIIDGKEAVSFLVKIKEGVEDPERLLLEI
ncbi:MAG: 2-oxoglutarate dehydrogenase complex dihydrolipoyllysine-residue succinyltransferase [Pseudobdellovibrionaceae bacterium]